MNKENRILGTFYGQALGDAMGMPSELWPRSRVKAHFGLNGYSILPVVRVKQ